MPDVYRHASSLLLLRARSDGQREFLLLHKPRKRDAWQLPQGGKEADETPEQTAVRELKEEAGIDDVRVFAVSDRVYQYDFPPSYRKFRPDGVCGQRISFVIGGTSPGAVVTVDAKEVDRYKWIVASELPRYVKRTEYLDIIRHLLQESAAFPL